MLRNGAILKNIFSPLKKLHQHLRSRPLRKKRTFKKLKKSWLFVDTQIAILFEITLAWADSTFKSIQNHFHRCSLSQIYLLVIPACFLSVCFIVEFSGLSLFLMVCWCYSFLSRFSLIFEHRVVICCLAKFRSVLCHLFLCLLALLYPFRVDVTEFPFYGSFLLDGLLYYFSIIVEFGFWSILGWCFIASYGFLQFLVYI